MSFQLPAAVPYALGTILLVFGALRAFYFGWRRRDREIAVDDSPEESAARTKMARSHLRGGILWVALGLILVISTYIQSHR
jgi:hypothetical protein